MLPVHWNVPAVQIIRSHVPLLHAWVGLHVELSQPVRLLLHVCSTLPMHV